MISEQELFFIAAVAVILLCVGILLSSLSTITNKMVSSTQKRLENILPGMNCGQCGFPGCQAYAEALVSGKASAALCHPGGPEITDDICAVLGIGTPITEDYDEMLFTPRPVAFIHESVCNGCGKCAKHCKVDAIVGNLKTPHHIDTENCIGCSECIEICPQRCIEMVRVEQGLEHFDWKIDSVRITSGLNK